MKVEPNFLPKVKLD